MQIDGWSLNKGGTEVFSGLNQDSKSFWAVLCGLSVGERSLGKAE